MIMGRKQIFLQIQPQNGQSLFLFLYCSIKLELCQAKYAFSVTIFSSDICRRISERAPERRSRTTYTSSRIRAFHIRRIYRAAPDTRFRLRA